MSNDTLAGFCQLASQQKNLALVFLIEKVLKHPKVHVFGELLSVKSVIALKAAGTEAGDDGNKESYTLSYNTLELFAYGTFEDYMSNPSQYIELGEDMARKLKQLSIITMAMKNKILTYKELQSKLGLADVRTLEDLIIDTIYKGLITAKMNQKDQILRVQSFAGRDVKPEELPNLINQLSVFMQICDEQIKLIQDVSSVVKSSREKNEKDAGEIQQRFDNAKSEYKKKLKGQNQRVDALDPEELTMPTPKTEA